MASPCQQGSHFGGCGNRPLACTEVFYSCSLLMTPLVEHASHQPAQPRPEGSPSHRWKLQTGSLEALPCFLPVMIFCSLYSAGLSYPAYFSRFEIWDALFITLYLPLLEGDIDCAFDQL